MNNFEKLEKKALYSMYISTIIATVIGVGVLSGIIFISPLHKYKIAIILYAVIVGLAVMNVIISPVFRYNRYRYRMDEESIETISGYIFVTHKIVPIERIQNLEVNQGPFDRYFGVANVNVTTGGGDVDISYISKANADAIAETLKVKINQLVISNKEQEGAENGEK